MYYNVIFIQIIFEYVKLTFVNVLKEQSYDTN